MQHRERPGPVCELCGSRIDTAREPYAAGRGKSILGPEYAGRIVAVHDQCAAGYSDPYAADIPFTEALARVSGGTASPDVAGRFGEPVWVGEELG
jgi:hypothetical protein